jgi:peptide alpha-N-acetyltransferase
MTTIPENRVLPAKLKEVFTSLHKSYERKDFINGIKLSNQILEKYSNHGETLAMKGLMTHSSGTWHDIYCINAVFIEYM